MRLNRFMIRPLVEQALREELGPGDTTGGFLVGDDPVQTGQIYAKGSGIICGLLLADETIRTVDPDDRRVGRLQLTASAQRIADESRAARRAALSTALERLDDDRIAHLTKGLEVMAELTRMLAEVPK